MASMLLSIIVAGPEDSQIIMPEFTRIFQIIWDIRCMEPERGTLGMPSRGPCRLPRQNSVSVQTSPVAVLPGHL